MAINRRQFLGRSAGIMGACLAGLAHASEKTRSRPNILFAIADDWSWPHASIYGTRGVDTPAFDRVAREGCLFANAFTAAPQCSPNRAATLTGRNIWQLEEAGTHGSIFPKKHAVFPDLLEAAGYHAGFTGKGWSPGDWKRGGWERNPAGPEYNARKLKSVPAKGISKTDYAGNFAAFLERRPKDTPFCFWYGAREPHRAYEEGSGLKAGKGLGDAAVPAFLPDTQTVRSDILDYFVEVEWFDTQLGEMLRKLEEIGELDNTIVVVTGDNGMPFPRAKANLHDLGTHVPLAVRWLCGSEAGRETDGLVSFIDFAPTFLEAAGLTPPDSMTGKSLLGFLTGRQSEPLRDYVLTGRERHTHARYDNLGYPSRSLRTRDYLYIRNFKPERWPAGDPDGYHDIDESPTKTAMLENRAECPKLAELAFDKRPAEEVYAIKDDPGCLRNLAGDPGHEAVGEELAAKLEEILRAQGDPRVLGTGDVFESYPRVSSMRPQLGGFAERGKYNPAYQPKR